MLVLNKLKNYIVRKINAGNSPITSYVPHACNVYHYTINDLYQGIRLVNIFREYLVDIYTRYRFKPNEFLNMKIKIDQLTIKVMTDVLTLVFETNGSRLGNLISSVYSDDDLYISYDYKTNQKKTICTKHVQQSCCNYYEQTIVYQNDILIRVEHEMYKNQEDNCSCPDYNNIDYMQFDYDFSGNLSAISINEHRKNYVMYKKHITFEPMECE